MSEFASGSEEPRPTTSTAVPGFSSSPMTAEIRSSISSKSSGRTPGAGPHPGGRPRGPRPPPLADAGGDPLVYQLQKLGADAEGAAVPEVHLRVLQPLAHERSRD